LYNASAAKRYKRISAWRTKIRSEEAAALESLSEIERKRVALSNGVELAYYCWNPEDHDKPPLILVHGTGFVGATFHETALPLREHFRVYAYDRRGHGHSSKPANAYELWDFAEDCVEFCQALGLSSTYAIGHSAGGTDVLIAESFSPGLFSKIFVMEPTLRDPRRGRASSSEISKLIQPRLEQTRQRRGVFDSRAQVRDSYRSKPLFQPWTDQALDAYIDDGFCNSAGGGVELQCTPDIEAKILEPIYLAFQNAYHGDDRGDPFATLDKIACPMFISQSRLSEPPLDQLADRACLHFPNAIRHTFHCGHCVPQEDPKALVEAIREFWFS